MTEADLIDQLARGLKEMAHLAKGTPEQSAIDHDLQVLRPHADPLPFYFTVQATDTNLFNEEALLGAGHHGLVVADNIYSDIGALQQYYDYWLV